jgi:prepilin-type processing-associated H-X9-DG protein
MRPWSIEVSKQLHTPVGNKILHPDKVNILFYDAQILLTNTKITYNEMESN